MIHVLLALIASASALTAQVDDPHVQGEPETVVHVDLVVVGNGTVHVTGDALDVAVHANGTWGDAMPLPTTFDADPTSCARGLCGRHTLRLGFGMPQVDATRWVTIADDEGGVTFPVRLTPTAAPAPPPAATAAEGTGPTAVVAPPTAPEGDSPRTVLAPATRPAPAAPAPVPRDVPLPWPLAVVAWLPALMWRRVEAGPRRRRRCPS